MQGWIKLRSTHQQKSTQERLLNGLLFSHKYEFIDLSIKKKEEIISTGKRIIENN